MATTTPNFGWPVPTSTDLVKDGATAIEALGDGVDASMVDLKGGLTGQVLAKTTNADMDFTWVTTDDTNAIQNAIVDAKGDLIAASAADTPARLAVGSNGETLVADSSTSTGLRYQGSQAAGRNAIINGNFDIWQRGTSFSINNNTAFTADRFVATVTNTMTLSRQTTGVPAGSQYCLRMASTFSNSVADFFQYIETANVVPLQGKTVTFSTRLRKNAANTADAIILVQKSATTDAGSGATWTTISSTTVPTASLPTGTTSADWYLATLTIAIPNDATANSLRVYISTAAQIANTAYLEIAQVSLEIGSVPTTFTRAGGTIQGELSACMRYYQNQYVSSNRFALGFSISTTTGKAIAALPVAMRVPPTSMSYGGTVIWYDGIGGASVGTLVSENPTTISCGLAFSGSSGLTANRPIGITGNSADAYLAFSAEL